MGRLSRRELAALLAAVPLSAQSNTPPPEKSTAAPAPANVHQAADEVRRIGEELRGIDVPMSMEPAFSFKA
jgi:hypothetical protein